MSAPRRQAVIVGMFVSFGLAILVGAILVTGDIGDLFGKKVRVTAVFDDVGGLGEGDNVRFSGVKVGTVGGVAIRPDARVEVILEVDAEAAPFIRRDALATVGSDGMLGDRIIVIDGGTPEAPPIGDGDVLQIGETLSPEDIMAEVRATNANLQVVTKRLADGEGTVGQLLADDALYVRLDATLARLEAASGHAEQLTDELAAFSVALNREGHLAHDLVADTRIYPSILRSAAEAESFTTDLADAAENPDTPLGVLARDEEAGADLKSTFSNLDDGSRYLAEDLEAVQHNFLLRRYFKKRDREQSESTEAQEKPR